VPYSFSSGESGDQMIACFRQAMGLLSPRWLMEPNGAAVNNDA
jgi:hypothetical protein